MISGWNTSRAISDLRYKCSSYKQQLGEAEKKKGACCGCWKTVSLPPSLPRSLALLPSLPLFLSLVLILGKTGPWWWFQLLSASDRWLLLIYDLWCMCRKASSSLCMSPAMSFPFKVAEPVSLTLDVLFFSVLTYYMHWKKKKKERKKSS